MNLTIRDDSSLQLYHKRYGRQDKQHIKFIIGREFKVKVKADTKSCEVCAYGKSHRLKFNTRKKPTKEGEFNGETVEKTLKKHGVTQRLSTPCTPQQKGSIEKENRSIVEMARVLKYSNEEVE